MKLFPNYFTICLLILTINFLSLAEVHSQNNTTGIVKSRITFQPDSLVNNDFTVELEVQDTLNINSIDLSLGYRVDSTNIFTYEFIYDINSGLPINVSYQRVGNKILLNLGAQPKFNMYFCRVRIKNALNIYGPYQKFIAN